MKLAWHGAAWSLEKSDNRMLELMERLSLTGAIGRPVSW